MADFITADAKTAKLEGGYQARTSDKGNFYQGQLIGTNRGISAPTLASYLGRTPTVADMKALDAPTAAKIRRAGYWVPIQGDKIANQSLAGFLYDFAVHSGPSTATLHVQRQLNKLGAALTVDGAAGPRTLAALNGVPQEALFNLLKTDRAYFLTQLAADDPADAEWLAGWLTRLDSFVFPQPAPASRARVAG